MYGNPVTSEYILDFKKCPIEGSFPKQDLVKVVGIDLSPDILTCHKRQLSALATSAQSEAVISHNIDSRPDPERNANTRRLKKQVFLLGNLTI
ncbi:hypothetical protein TNCV_3441611 [Trichonephila clavipes]|nr:hypothetical protein TNCV_3441611 [Trichonephila clavipes]